MKLPKIPHMNSLCWAVGYQCVLSEAHVPCLSCWNRISFWRKLAPQWSVTLNGTEQCWLSLPCKRHFFSNRSFLCNIWKIYKLYLSSFLCLPPFPKIRSKKKPGDCAPNSTPSQREGIVKERGHKKTFLIHIFIENLKGRN